MSLRRILAIGKNPEVQQLAQQFGREIFGADDLADAVEIVQSTNPNLILFDQRFKPDHIREFFDQSDKSISDIPVVVIGSEDSDAELSSEYIQMGVYDYLHGKKDYDWLERIVNRIKMRINTNSSKETSKFKQQATSSKYDTNHYFENEIAGSVSMVGRSKAIVGALKMIQLVAASQCNPVLIVGETGTGKELVAKAIHTIRHANEVFVAVNCAALTANLLESELFGHVKGSFTGADREKTGLLEVAASGTLFLDEISEMPMDLQAKLLRVLQERNFRKVGGISDIPCQATIIASSNRDLKSEVLANRFRRDLYYRLNISPIVLAPLKSPERRSDIRLLTEYFLLTSNICPDKRNKVTSITELAVEALEKHDWPGNVRELKNVIDRAVLLETTDKIGLSSIMLDPTECSGTTDSPANGLIKTFSLAKAERELISRALQETGWQKTRAAALLGITRATLYAKVKQYNLEKDLNNSDQDESQSSSASLPESAAFGF